MRDVYLTCSRQHCLSEEVEVDDSGGKLQAISIWGILGDEHHIPSDFGVDAMIG